MGSRLPVVLLTFDRSDPEFLPREKPAAGVDRVFLWTALALTLRRGAV